jgi:hypothetical protein
MSLEERRRQRGRGMESQNSIVPVSTSRATTVVPTVMRKAAAMSGHTMLSSSPPMKPASVPKSLMRHPDGRVGYRYFVHVEEALYRPVDAQAWELPEVE